jgi:hypothetical protein
MLLKLHSRTPARLVLAGLLAVTSISALAQTAAPLQGSTHPPMSSNRLPELPPMPGRGPSGDGRLKPAVVNPRLVSQDDQQMWATPGMAHLPAGDSSLARTAPGTASPPANQNPNSDPFAPVQRRTAGSAIPGATTTKVHTASPAINLACTTPEIKTQGVFLGKIQNRYVYKYKSQYCFDIEP